MGFTRKPVVHHLFDAPDTFAIDVRKAHDGSRHGAGGVGSARFRLDADAREIQRANRFSLLGLDPASQISKVTSRADPVLQRVWISSENIGESLSGFLRIFDELRKSVDGRGFHTDGERAVSAVHDESPGSGHFNSCVNLTAALIDRMRVSRRKLSSSSGQNSENQEQQESDGRDPGRR